VRQLGYPWAVELAGRVAELAGHLDRYADADLAARRGILARVRDDLSAIQAFLGAPAATLPQTLVYEDTRASDVVLEIGTRRWTELVGRSLRELSSVMPVFDISLAHRLTLKGFFLARFGAGGTCDDLLTLVRDFHEDIYDEYVRTAMRRTRFAEDGSYVKQDNWLHVPEIAALDRARAAFVDGMRELWSANLDSGKKLDLGHDVLARAAEELLPLGAELRPQGYFLQVAWQGDQILAVLNRSIGGLSFPFSRFTHCFEDIGAAPLADLLRESLRDVQPEGAVFAEIVGGVASTNLNLHGRLTDYQIVCPGEQSSLPLDNQLALEDLFIRHDVANGRLVLRSRRLDCEVIPLYLGYLMPMALPEIPRTLLLLSPLSLAALDLWGGVPEGPDDQGVTTRPRVQYGNLVLSRRSWSADTGALPVRATFQQETDWLLAWRRWQLTHGVPDQAFATFQGAADEDNPNGGWMNRSKPHYVDFASPYSLLVLDSQIKTSGRSVVFREMLPAPDELYLTSERGYHVAELGVEMTLLDRGEPV
jgi:hypothetical protein